MSGKVCVTARCRDAVMPDRSRFDAAAAVTGSRDRHRSAAAVVPDTCAEPFRRAQFDLLVLNIAANAGDAMLDGGHFTITVTAGDDGAGLGLSVVAAMVGEAGGTVAVESAPGEGTDILLRLPAAADRVEASPDRRTVTAKPLQ